MNKHLVVVATLVAACGNKDKGQPKVDTARGSSVSQGSADSGVGSVATPDDAASAATSIPVPPPGSLVGKEPPVPESVHLEVSYALAKWHATPRDKSVYAADFGGRDIADAREPLLAYEQWLPKLPVKPAFIQNADISSWLENKDRGDNMTRVNVSYFYDGRDQYRELMFRRDGARQLLVSEKVNSENHSEAPYVSRNWLPTDATALGAKLTARFGFEGSFAWVAVTNEKGEQRVADLWPDGPCAPVELPKDAPKGALAMLRCTNSGEGHDFTLLQDKDELRVRRAPAGKDAPSGTDRTFKLAKGAKVTLPNVAAIQ